MSGLDFAGSYLQISDSLGILHLSIPVKSIEDALLVRRTVGARGWTSGDVPTGGYVFPYAMADSFDFALIGAREFTQTDKETGEVTKKLQHRGQYYTRRDEPAINKGAKKLPARVWYSRGAKAADGVDKDSDGFAYVCLISFVGAGDSIREYEKPKQQSRPEELMRAKQQQRERDPVAEEEARHANKPAPAKFDRGAVVKAIIASFGYEKQGLTKTEMAPICEEMTKVMGREVKNFSPDDHAGGMSDASLEHYIRTRPNRA
jgi:hypothetical protein